MGGRLMQVESTARRSEGRFFINSKATRVTVRFARENGEDVSARGQLADLSLRGVKICIDHKMNDDQPVDLVIEIPTMDFRVERKAIVRWQHPRDATTFWTGCEVRESFDDDLIEKLASAHVLNRRRDPRYATDRPARVRWELSDRVLDARLVNFSKGGFCICLLSPTEFPSERLMLVLEERGKEVTIPARVMWEGPMPGGYGVGCAFSTMDGFVKLREAANVAGARTGLRKSLSSKRAFWILFAVFVLAVLQLNRQVRDYPSWFVSAAKAWNYVAQGYGLPEISGIDAN
jgi:hypothetical protein